MLFMSKPAARIQKKQNGTIMMRAFEVKKKENQVELKIKMATIDTSLLRVSTKINISISFSLSF